MSHGGDHSYDVIDTPPSSSSQPAILPTYTVSRLNTPPPLYQDVVPPTQGPPPSYGPPKSHPTYPPPSYNQVPVYNSITLSSSSNQGLDLTPTSPDQIADHMVLAIVSIFIFWPLGVLAVLKASEVRTLKASGDLYRAQQSSIYTWRLAVVAIITGVIIFCFLIVPVVIFVEVSPPAYDTY